MSDPVAAPERIDLSRADDLRDVIHRAVACLAQGGLVVLPTETTYLVAASALRPEAVARIGQLIEGEAAQPVGFAWLGLKEPEELSDWVPNASATTRRLASRGWPGPLAIIAPTGAEGGLLERLPESVIPALDRSGALGLICPLHPIVREIDSLLAGPMVLATLGPPVHESPEPFLSLPGVEMILDDGPTELTGPMTIVRVDGDSWRVERPGVVEDSMLHRLVGTVILFVCTGNTCRSPMAEALFKAALARRLGCQPAELDARGFVVLSGGLHASPGGAASTHAITAVRDLGGSLDQHRSRRVTADLVDQADHIVTMTQDHLDALLWHVPEAGPRARLLNPDGLDVDDPYGSDLESYRATARDIADHVERLAARLLEG